MKHTSVLIIIICGLSMLCPEARAQRQDDARQVRNITAFCRLFGYIRYFHPSDETQQLDWERFAIYGSHRVMDAPDDRQLLNRLKELFQPVAPTARIFLATDAVHFDRKALAPLQGAGYREISWQYTGMSMRFVKAYPRPEPATVRLNRSSWELIPRHYDTAGQGMMTQTLPAAYNGGRFVIQAKMKVHSFASGNAAGELGLLNITSEGEGKSYSATSRDSRDGIWKDYRISGEVDEKCTQLLLWVMLRKKGWLQVKDLSLSIVRDGHTYAIPVEYDRWAPQPNNNYTSDVRDTTLKISYIDSSGLSRRPDSPLYKYRTHVGEYIHKELTPGIECIVPLAVYGNEQHTWPVVDPRVLQRLKNTVARQTPAYLTADSLDVRLGDIVIAWNIYRHFFPFWDEASQTAEQILHDAIVRACRNKNAAEFFGTLQLMTAPLNDEHIFPSYEKDTSIYGLAGVSLTIAENKILIKDVLDKAFQQTVRPGDVVDSINGMTAWEALAETERYMSGSPHGKRFMALYRITLGYPGSPMPITVHRGTDTIRTIFRKTGWADWHSVIDTLPASGSELSGGIYYVNLLEAEEKVAPVIGKLSDARAIIFDMRGYPSFDLFDMVMTHLITESKGNPSILYDPQIIYPDFEKVRYTLSDLDVRPRAPLLKGKIYFLSNAAIGSHPEYFLALVKAYKLGTIIGQSTAGLDGTINGFSLPGGYALTFTGIKAAPVPGTSSRLEGVPPDIRVEPTLSSIAAGRDEILEQAIKIAKQHVN
jgi:hypothetical protein